jgi:hypothetical protein
MINARNMPLSSRVYLEQVIRQRDKKQVPVSVSGIP